MRPKKAILLISNDPDLMGRYGFLLETHRYHTLRAEVARATLAAKEITFDAALFVLGPDKTNPDYAAIIPAVLAASHAPRYLGGARILVRLENKGPAAFQGQAGEQFCAGLCSFGILFVNAPENPADRLLAALHLASACKCGPQRKIILSQPREQVPA